MSILEKILAAKAVEVERLKPRKAELQRLAADQAPARPFAAALRAGDNVALIAEFKRRSPSAGWIRQDGSVAEITKAYSDFGARAISVLTDAEFFGGALSDLETTHDKTTVPVLRKDFIIDEIQLLEARAAGADAVLLIVRALSQQQLRDLFQFAKSVGLDVLTETHNEAEVEAALKAECDVVGINNRDLSTFHVDHDLSRRMASLIPADVAIVAESGVKVVGDVASVGAVGIEAVLVGETLMKSANLEQTVREFSSQKRVSRG